MFNVLLWFVVLICGVGLNVWVMVVVWFGYCLKEYCLEFLGGVMGLVVVGFRGWWWCSFVGGC